jgi:hypothetical protein
LSLQFQRALDFLPIERFKRVFECGLTGNAQGSNDSRGPVHDNENQPPIVPFAPAAGSGIVRDVAAELATRPGFVQKMADALENGLTATKRMWDAGSKQWIEEPDTRCQLQALFGAFSHFVGDPQKRILHEHIAAAGIDPLGALRESPALREAAKAMLDKAEWRTSGQQAHKRPAKQVTPGALEAEIEV